MKARTAAALACLLGALFFPVCLFSQEPPAGAGGDTVEFPLPGGGETGDIAPRTYYIRSVDFEIEGRTRPFALLRQGEFKEGERIEGEAGLERYLARKTQMLMNQRVLESVDISYTLGEGETEGGEELIPADLLVRVRDTWNIIALPYPKYDSNSGFEFIIKARDYNFLGTMSPLRIDFGYKRSTDNENTFLFEIDSDTAFTAFGYIWNFNFDHAFAYTQDAPLYYKNTTGLSMELPFKTTTFTFGFDEYVIFNEENSDADKHSGYGDRFDGGYMASELYTFWKIPTGIKVGYFGDLNYTPKLTGKINYRPGASVDYPRSGPSLEFSHSLGFGRTDWAGNYRQGLETVLANSFRYTFYDDAYYREKWNRNLSLSSTGHFPVSDFFGISGRLRLRAWFDDPLDSAGDDLRGILDKRIQAKTMLALSMDFPLRILRFYPSELFHNEKLRFFNFDLHLSPFVDLALARGWSGEPSPLRGAEQVEFAPGDLFWTGGAELIVFPAFMRSLYLRVSLGYNVKEIIKTGDVPKWDELFIGLGHYY